MRIRDALSGLVVSLLLTACPRDRNPENSEFVVSEAKQALEESAVDAQAQTLSSDLVEISTNFTIGGALEAAAEELRSFVNTQLPCADVTRDGVKLTVVFGAKGTCYYHGRIITGQSTISVTRNESSDVVVEHDFDALSNGIVQLDGTATVTYDLADPSRHVEHDTSVTRLSDGFRLESSGDRVQRPLAEGLAVGFVVNGTREWSSPRGSSSLLIEDVQMRWIDPVPQAGNYRLTTPKNREVSFEFSRKDADTISVTLAAGGREYVFDVSRAGAVKQTE